MFVMIDVLCPSCSAVNGCLPPGVGPIGVRCRTCGIDFIAKMETSRVQKTSYGRGYERCKPRQVVTQPESLLPKDEEKETAVEKPMLVIRDLRPIMPVAGMVIDG